jgi:hypothetical protein
MDKIKEIIGTIFSVFGGALVFIAVFLQGISLIYFGLQAAHGPATKEIMDGIQRVNETNLYWVIDSEIGWIQVDQGSLPTAYYLIVWAPFFVFTLVWGLGAIADWLPTWRKIRHEQTLQGMDRVIARYNRGMAAIDSDHRGLIAPYIIALESKIKQNEREMDD